jgi:3-deoxy-D-manno-octulosonate 8-phosphate phosphatase (KDO 8-P phosphatase)
MEGRFSRIRAFAFDVDGVLTDGGILADLNGELYRTFDSKDGMAIRMAVMKGFHMAIITGGRSESIRHRFESCGIKPEDVYLRSRAKIEDFEDFCTRHGLSAEEVMYFGDDLPDIPVMVACGCGVCPSDAVEEVKEIADFISTRPGGKGCARELIQTVLKEQGKWELDVQAYKKHF